MKQKKPKAQPRIEKLTDEFGTLYSKQRNREPMTTKELKRATFLERLISRLLNPKKPHS